VHEAGESQEREHRRDQQQQWVPEPVDPHQQWVGIAVALPREDAAARMEQSKQEPGQGHVERQREEPRRGAAARGRIEIERQVEREPRRRGHPNQPVQIAAQEDNVGLWPAEMGRAKTSRQADRIQRQENV
jgi:hypothetical protein